MINNIKMASPLFILRDECEKDLFKVLAKLKNIGYDGIEFVGFYGHSAQEIKENLDRIGLEALGNHVPYAELEKDCKATIDFHVQIGCSYITVSNLPLADGIEKISSNLDIWAELARQKGITLLYHNHDDELIDKIDGIETLEYIMENTNPDSLKLEPDLGWIEIGGGDPARYLTKYVNRCPVVHFKDYYSSDNSKLGRVREFSPNRGTAQRGHFEFRPTGYGIVNTAKLLPLALACKPTWFVMDHDLEYDRDAINDLKISLEYMINLMNIQK